RRRARYGRNGARARRSRNGALHRTSWRGRLLRFAHARDASANRSRWRDHFVALRKRLLLLGCERLPRPLSAKGALSAAAGSFAAGAPRRERGEGNLGGARLRHRGAESRIGLALRHDGPSLAASAAGHDAIIPARSRPAHLKARLFAPGQRGFVVRKTPM